MPPKAKKSKTVKCNICNKRYADQHGLNRHMEIHEEGQYSCDQCDYTCKVAQYLARHKTRMHTDSKKLQCDICKKMFQWQSRLTHHMLVHTGEKPYKCGTCGKAFNSHYSLTTHKLIHTDEKPFKCMYCEYACRDSSTLRKHHARHAGTLPKYRCSVCTRTFTSKFRVKRHVAEVHLQLDVRTHVCHVCDKAFMEKKQLTLHVKAVHEKLKTCTCDICGRTISNSANLRAHLMTHLDTRPYACARPGCTRSYKDQSSLKKHTATHYKEMQHECEICGKWFTRAERWKRHLLQHLPKVKSVECDYCGVSFYNKKYLATHIHRKHTRAGRQRYVCDLCDFETANKPSIVMHLKYGHGNRLNKECLECGKKFKTDKFFKLHMAKVHEAGSETMSTNDIAEVDVKIEPLDDVDIDIFEVDRDHILQDLLTTVDNETASNDKVENDIFDGNENVTHENNKLDTGNDYEIENSHNKAGYNIHDTNDHETGDSDETDYDTRSQETNNSNEGFDNHKSGNDIPADTGNNRETVHDTRTDIETGKDLDTNKSHKAADNQETGNDKTDNKKANNIYGSANNGTNDIEASNNKYEDGNDSVNGNENHGPSNDIYEGNNSVDGNENHEANNAIYEGNDSVDGNENHEASNDIYEGVDGNEERHIVIEASVFEAISAHSKQLRRAPEKLFEGLSEVVRGGERAASTERGSKYLVDKKIEEERRRQMLKLLAKARREKEVKLLERTRDEYNKRLRELLSGKKTENIKIKYFKNNNKNNLNNQTITIDDEDSLQNDETLRYEEESESESEETESSVDRNNEKETNDKDSSTVNGNDKNHEVGDGNENDETVGGIDDENGDDDKSDKDYEPPKEPEGKKHKIKFNSHQCYSCFKLFPTKQQLLDHCKDHFDICHDSPLVICPVCGDVMKKNFTKHLKQVHNLTVKVPYARIKDKHSNKEGSRYYLELDDPTLKEVEIIPSVKNLNKIASTKIDENNREAKNNVIAKTKIVKKGKEWIVQNETVEVNEEYILPNFDINVTINEKKLKLNESFNNDYVERLKRLSRIAKKNGKKMLYPCEKCPKICQALAALKLHTRKHDPNKKPFKDKVYKGRTIKKGYKRDYRKDFTKLSRVDNVDKSNKKRNFRKDFTKVSPVNEVNAIKVTDINNLKPETYQNRFAKPQPIKNKHKCDPELKEFYEKNIRGGDIEFWQFLKIFNKIDREKIEDFSDLEQRHEFGIIPKNSIAENEEFDVNTNCNNNTKVLNNKIAKDTSKSKNKCNIKDKSRIECKTTSFDAVVRMNVKRNMADGYKRILRISKREYEKRNAIRNELREKIARERDGK